MGDYYVNDAVRKMYGIPLSQLTPEQRRILREDGKRRAKLIEERQKDVMQNNRKAFDDAEKMNRVLSSIYESCQRAILADVAATQAKVKKAGGEWSYANQSALTRSRGLFEQINNELVKLGKKENEYFRKNLTNIYTDQFLRATYTLGQTQTVKGNFNMLNPRLIEAALDYPWSGAMFSDRLWLDKDRLGRNLRIGLTQSMILGEDMDRIADRIQANIDTSRYNAMRIARTETKRVCYVSQVEAWKAQGVSEVRYMAANGGDSRSCNLCKSDNGKKYKLGEEPTLPRHPNCRCWYNPVTPDTFGDNELNELTGSIRGAENYDKWKQEYEVALNPDGSYKTGWKRESWKDGGRVMYTAADGKRYTIKEYKDAMKYGTFSVVNISKADTHKDISSVEKAQNDLKSDVMSHLPDRETFETIDTLENEAYTKFIKDIDRVRAPGAVQRVTTEYLTSVGSKVNRVEFNGVDTEVAKKMAKKLVDLDRTWVSTLQEISVDSGSFGYGVAGVCTPYVDIFNKTGNDKDLYSRIRVNSSFYSSMKKALETWEDNEKMPFNVLVKKEFFSVDTLVHEYAHSILGGKVSEVYGTNSKPYGKIKKIYQRYKKELSDLSSAMSDVRFKYSGQENGLKRGMEDPEYKRLKKEYDRKHVSKYGDSSVGEFIAESFTMVECGESVSPYAKEVYGVLKEYFLK